MPPDQQSSVIFYPIDAEFNAQFLTLPTLLFALPIISITAIVWVYWQLGKLTFIAGRATFRRLKKSFN